jgi:hypothetical protein
LRLSVAFPYLAHSGLQSAIQLPVELEPAPPVHQVKATLGLPIVFFTCGGKDDLARKPAGRAARLPSELWRACLN